MGAGVPLIQPGGDFNVPQLPRPAIAPGAGTEELGTASRQLEEQATVLGQHFARLRRLTDFNDAMADYNDAADQTVEELSRNPALRADPDAMREAVKSKLTDLSKDIVQRYPHANQFGMLERNFTHMTAAKARTMWAHSIANFDEDQKKRLATNEIGALDQVTNATDPKDAAMFQQNYFDTIDAHVHAGVISEGDADLMKAQFSQKALIGQGIKLATTGGDLATFLQQHSTDLTPEQVTSMTNAYTAAIKKPMLEIDAQRAGQRAQALKELDQNPDPGKIQSLTDSGVITKEDFQRYMHYAYMPLGNPTEVRRMQDNISSALDDHDLDALTETLHSPQGQEMYGRNAAALEASISTARHSMNHGADAAYQEGVNEINDAFDNLGERAAEYTAYASMTKGVPTIFELRERAIGDLRVKKSAGVSDLEQIRKATSEAIATHQPDYSVVDGGVPRLPKRAPHESAGEWYRRIKGGAPPVPALPPTHVEREAPSTEVGAR